MIFADAGMPKTLEDRAPGDRQGWPEIGEEDPGLCGEGRKERIHTGSGTGRKPLGKPAKKMIPQHCPSKQGQSGKNDIRPE